MSACASFLVSVMLGDTFRGLSEPSHPAPFTLWLLRDEPIDSEDKQQTNVAQAQCQLAEFTESDVFNGNQSMSHTSTGFAYAQKGQGSTEPQLALENCH